MYFGIGLFWENWKLMFLVWVWSWNMVISWLISFGSWILLWCNFNCFVLIFDMFSKFLIRLDRCLLLCRIILIVLCLDLGIFILCFSNWVYFIIELSGDCNLWLILVKYWFLVLLVVLVNFLVFCNCIFVCLCVNIFWCSNFVWCLVFLWVIKWFLWVSINNYMVILAIINRIKYFF